MRIDVFTERGRQLSEVRKLLSPEPSYASATALLSVHAAIALNDAVLVQLTGASLSNDNHMDAVRQTVLACRAKGIDSRGAVHLQKLLSAKSDVAYGNKAVSFELATKLATASERFQVWAEGVLGGQR